jgi:hypothetical protein
MGRGFEHTGEHLVLRLADLRCDPRVQRDFRAHRKNYLVANWSDEHAAEIHVSIRDDDFKSVVDGWHRTVAAMELGIERWLCTVYRGLTVKQEAEKFRVLNNQLTTSALDDFNAAITAEDDKACSINQVVQGVGLAVGNAHTSGHIAAVRALTDVYTGARLTGDRENSRQLRQTLRVILGAWGKQTAGLDGNMIRGVGYVVLRYGDAVDLDRLRDKLADYQGGPGALLGAARQTATLRKKSTPHCVASTIIDVYNVGLRTRALPDWFSAPLTWRRNGSNGQ